MACGGRLAEELIFGADRITTGASSDIRMVSDMSRRMITEWGMSERLGFLAYSADQQEVFLGHSVTQQKNVSDATAKVIDEEIRRVTDDAYEEARRILSEHMDDLHTLAKGLLEYETLSGDDINDLLAGRPVDRTGGRDDGHKQAAGRRASVPTGGAETPGAGGLEPDPQPGD